MNVERVLDSLDLDWIRILLWKHYHSDGPGRNPFDPLAMFKAQLIKYLLQIPGDRRLALRLRSDHARAGAATPTHARAIVPLNKQQLIYPTNSHYMNEWEK